jgi:hypothetical protein
LHYLGYDAKQAVFQKCPLDPKRIIKPCLWARLRLQFTSIYSLILDTYRKQCKMGYCINNFLKMEHGRFFRQKCNPNEGAASIDRIPAPLRKVIQNNRLQHGKRS